MAAIHLPLVCLNRSSAGRTEASSASRSMPEASCSVAGAVEARSSVCDMSLRLEHATVTGAEITSGRTRGVMTDGPDYPGP
ncbi:hypothetical protein ACFPRL_15805 [Pseudoclavibacter helvolus]